MKDKRQVCLMTAYRDLNLKRIGERFFYMRFLFFFYYGFTVRQDYFTHFELNQLLGEAKTGDPQLKNTCPASRTQQVSHMIRARLKPTDLETHRFRALKISVVNHSATGPPNSLTENLLLSHISLIKRKPVFGVCDQGELKPACSATETS